MLACFRTAALFGVDACAVNVEVDVSFGLPSFTMVGLPDSAMKESEARIRAALRNCGLELKWDRRITVNLAPASLRKAGSSYDLATALGLLGADGTIPMPHLGRVLLVGELALDGAVRGVAGVLPMLILARQRGLDAAVVPAANHGEAALVPELAVHPASSLQEALAVVGALSLPAAPAAARGRASTRRRRCRPRSAGRRGHPRTASSAGSPAAARRRGERSRARA